MKRTLFTLLAAGSIATIAFDAYGQGISPAIGMAKLAPVGLANATLNTVFGSVPSGMAYLLHMLTGTVFYVLGYFLVARPLQRAVLPQLHWSVTAALYGLGLWIFALYIMAHLVAGMPAFLGFTGITYVALYGHVLYALVAAWVIEAHGLQFEGFRRRATWLPA
ncbi:hypothetical protein KDD17_16800 [Sulfitobacter albidus]|uniref:DUF1440 domain-containing protein n=1 Tax=Sulfitobacter albidus TaxID=2829501 RepID=A0A975PMK0_9RHOB|nr:hypothetical protein [Sulfitobacter albidus]QUJ76506.1 hypothetical protein KDD17_16800 [Sulfitobacter albidus]